MLVSDKGIEGAVIKLGKGLDHLEINETEVKVGAGFSLVNLSVQISKKGLAGLEFASGIPGSVGGAIYMNAGAHGSDMSPCIRKGSCIICRWDPSLAINRRNGILIPYIRLAKKTTWNRVRSIFSIKSWKS